MISGIAGLIDGALSWLYQFLIGLAAAAFDAVKDTFVDMISWFVSLLPTGWQSFLQQMPWEGLKSFWGPLNWFLPIYTCFAIYATAYTIVGAIRLARWCMAFFPGVSIFGNSVGPFTGA